MSSLKLECGHCISERCTEGMWDRFGTTPEQEIEAMCERHLIEIETISRKHSITFEEDGLITYADKLAAERKRRE